MVVPDGIYALKETLKLRRLFIDRCDWQWLFNFENREGIFDIASRAKFGPIVVRKSGTTQTIRTAFMHSNVDDWEDAERYGLAYPVEQIARSSPEANIVLELRGQEDLRILQTIYANSVLLGEETEQGWGLKQLREFDMTGDAELFHRRPDMEERGYVPDEYGHWLKGPWRDHKGPATILDRDRGLVLSRDGARALDVADIEDVALPLYEGRMVGQFDFSEKGWVSGSTRAADWRRISFDDKVLVPQYLMRAIHYLGDHSQDGEFLGAHALRVGFLRVTAATNERTMIAAALIGAPCGSTVPVLTGTKDPAAALNLQACLTSFAFDYVARVRLSGLSAAWFFVKECPLPKPTDIPEAVTKLSFSLLFAGKPRYAAVQLALAPQHVDAAVTELERLRVRCILDAVMFQIFGLSSDDAAHILQDCDKPSSLLTGKPAWSLNQKGFWRSGKEKEPELRHTVLSLVAFHDLQEKGMEAFLVQNDGEGWMIPETLRLADYGLGHDDRAKEHQPVAARLGPRFYDWQLNQDVERSWQECEAHAELIRKIMAHGGAGADAATIRAPQADAKPQEDLF